MPIPLAIAMVLALFLFVLFTGINSLVDTRARARLLHLAMPPDRAAYFGNALHRPRPWRDNLRRLLRSIRPPAFFEGWCNAAAISQAGISLSPHEYRALWWLLIPPGFLLSVVLAALAKWRVGGISLGMLILLLSLIGPFLYLRLKTNRRAREITRSLPDFLDLLTLSVEAGLGFEVALRRVVERYPGPLGQEMCQALRQIELGYSRADALEELVKRSPSLDIVNFVATVNLTERLGTPLAQTLRIQADLLRTRRRQRAQATAQTAPVRVIPALVFFFLPALLLIYLAPPILDFLLLR